VDGDVYPFRYTNYLDTGDFCWRSVVKIFIYAHFLTAAQFLVPFPVTTKVKIVLRACGSGRTDQFLEAFWSLLIHMNEPRRPASLLLSPAAPSGGNEIRHSRPSYQPKGSYTEPTEKKSPWMNTLSVSSALPYILPIMFCLLTGADNLNRSEATWSPLYCQGDGIWRSVLYLLSLLSLMIKVLLESDDVSRCVSRRFEGT
jgi:hypothetical protein